MEMQSLAGRGKLVKYAIAGLGIALAVTAMTATPAEARRRHHSYHGYAHRSHHAAHRGRHSGHSRHSRHAGAESYSPAFAAMVVDANSGRTLYAKNENELRHPASVTKVMTLFLLFEQLEKGRYRLDSPLEISAHAAAQAPSKLGLRPGSTIEVESAIKAVVTKSANDIAVAIAENIGGSEDSFAEMMTRKAHALGMSRTRYVNASGLPDDDQITTARDLTILGRAIQERFPRYYHYFSTPSFRYGGSYMRNHNHLLGRVEGMDGIKTGYTRQSGFNLLTSVKRDGHWVVSVVLGGRSGASRDRLMADLIEEHIDAGASSRTTMIAEAAGAGESRMEARAESAKPEAPRSFAKAEQVALERAEPARAIARAETVGAAAVPAVASIAVTTSPAIQDRQERPRPAFISGAPKPIADELRGSSGRPVLDGSTGRSVTASATAGLTATPSSMRWAAGPAPARVAKIETRIEVAKAEPAKAPTVRADSGDEPSISVGGGRPSRTGWMIQIGATDDPEKAQELLSRAKSQSRGALGGARPFTEKVQKGHETLWRARFAGLEENSAEAACRTLKHSGFSCFATKN